MSLLKRIAELIARPPAGTMPHEQHAAEVLAQELRTRSAGSAETLSRAARAAEAKEAEMTLEKFKRAIESARKSELAALETQAAQAVLARAQLPLSTQAPQPAPKPAPAPAPPKPATKSHKETILDAFRTGVAGEMAKPAPKPAASIGRDHSGQPVPRPAAKPAAAKPAPPPTSGLTRNEFNALPPQARMEFSRNGGKLAEVTDNRTAASFSPKSLSLAEFRQLSPLEKMKHARAGGKVSE
jgi:hypothetical protein